MPILTTHVAKNKGAIEQAILSHPAVGEASVVGIPDEMKGHLPFAFIQPKKASLLSSPSSSAAVKEQPLPAIPPPELFKEINDAVRSQIGAIASLGGIIQGKGMIPKTRSGKTLRRVLRELVENAVLKGDYEARVNVPPTVEDAEAVEVARARVREYFEGIKEKNESRIEPSERTKAKL